MKIKESILGASEEELASWRKDPLVEKVELPDEIKELFTRAGIKPHEVLRVRLPDGKTVTYLEENAGHRCIQKFSS